jgi:hypothetical protein
MDELLAIGTEVKFKYMPLTGTIVAYNEKPGHFGSESFPYMVHRSDGCLRAHAEDDFVICVLEIEHTADISVKKEDVV